MSESDEGNRDDEVDERLGEATTYSQGLNLNSRSTPIHITGLYPFWESNSSTQLQQESPQFDNNQAYPNMTFFQQPFPMPPYTNMFYQQPVQPSQHHTTQPQVDVNAFQHTTPPPPPPPPSLKASRRNKKNWTNEEDIQLTIAWLRITTDPAVGVGQKNDTLWERVLKLFVKLMHEHHKMKPEDCHVLKVGNELSDSVIKIGEISEKLFAAIQLLDQMDPCSLATNNQRMLYELRKNAVKDFQDRYEALGVLISHSKANSPPSVVPNENVENAGTSERPLFDEDEVHLGQDSQR